MPKFVPVPILDCKSRGETEAPGLDAIDSSRTVIHFYLCCQGGWQEYSEFSNSALLISSALEIGTNRQLGIFRNSEYPPKIPSPQLQPRHDRTQVDELSVTAGRSG